MPYRVHHAFLLLATLGAAACTTLTAEQRIAACQATDWVSYGENDGILGVATAARAAKFADCAALGDPPAIAAYRAGRAAVSGLARMVSSAERGGVAVGTLQRGAPRSRGVGPVRAGLLYDVAEPGPFYLAAALMGLAFLLSRRLPERGDEPADAVPVTLGG